MVGHIGLTPQSVLRMGGYRVQGRTEDAAARIVEDALALERAGAVAVVLEGIPREVAGRDYGDAAGSDDWDWGGAGLRWADTGVSRFVWAELSGSRRSLCGRFGDAGAVMRAGLEEFRAAVEAGTFPADAESYHLPAGVRWKLVRLRVAR